MDVESVLKHSGAAVARDREQILTTTQARPLKNKVGDIQGCLLNRRTHEKTNNEWI